MQPIRPFSLIVWTFLAHFCCAYSVFEQAAMNSGPVVTAYVAAEFAYAAAAAWLFDFAVRRERAMLGRQGNLRNASRGTWRIAAAAILPFGVGWVLAVDTFVFLEIIFHPPFPLGPSAIAVLGGLIIGVCTAAYAALREIWGRSIPGGFGRLCRRVFLLFQS